MDSLDNRFKEVDKARIGYLIGGFITGNLTIEEREELDAWVVASEANMQLFEELTDEKNVNEYLQWLAARDVETRLAQTKSRLKTPSKAKVVQWWKLAAAACLVCIVGYAIYMLTNKKEKQEQLAVNEKQDIPPGFTQAQLRLPGGKTVLLKDVDTTIGEIHIQDGQVIYGSENVDTAMHEIVIPRKGFYRLLLPDGSKVWLNSESSIKYPASFASDKREVTVTGETYFEVAKDASRPFRVTMGNMTVQALGTAFNMNAFDGTVTLTEGKVLIKTSGNSQILKPGEQCNARGERYIVEGNAVTAWTRNEFKFKDQLITQIMPQLQRWYDCEVVYENEVGFHFNGTIDRAVPLSRVLELLEGTERVHFKIEGRTVTVK